MEQILSLLRNIQQGGTFCAKKHADASHLKISVKDTLGSGSDLKYPLSARQAKSLIKLAQPAKYGWKDQTLYDPSVRNGWEIKKSKLQIDNRLWNKTLTPLLDQFKSVLGLPQESRITAHLHNLLIYEKGQFFSPHQDSEKRNGMVASLVVVLPSEFRGGTLAIDHHGEKKRFTAAGTSKDKLTLIAFYADCHHEVTPVTEGYRVALTYNLVLENAASPPVLSPGQIQLADALREPLQTYFSPPRQHGDTSAKASGVSAQRAGDRVRKWIYLLDHQYTQGSLQWNRLKNEDQTRVDAFRQATKSLDLEVHLALIDVQETCANNAKAHAAIIDYLMQQPGLFSMFDLTLTVKEALQRLNRVSFQSWGYSTLLDFTIERLKVRVSQGLRTSDDWSIERRSNCNCEYCGRLNQFLSSRNERSFAWPLSKERRAHIHQTIDKLGVPITHQTRREGSPQKLVLTKTDQLFAQDRHEFQNAERELSILERLKKGSIS